MNAASGAGGSGCLVELVDRVEIGLAADVVGQVWRLPVYCSQSDDIARGHDHLGLDVAFDVQQNDDGLARGDRSPAALGSQRLAALSVLVEVSGAGAPTAIRSECECDALGGALHFAMKARQGASKGLWLRHQEGLRTGRWCGRALRRVLVRPAGDLGWCIQGGGCRGANRLCLCNRGRGAA